MTSWPQFPRSDGRDAGWFPEPLRRPWRGHERRHRVGQYRLLPREDVGGERDRGVGAPCGEGLVQHVEGVEGLGRLHIQVPELGDAADNDPVRAQCGIRLRHRGRGSEADERQRLGKVDQNIGVQREVVLGDRRVEQVGDGTGGRSRRVTHEGAADDDRRPTDVGGPRIRAVGGQGGDEASSVGDRAGVEQPGR